MPLPIAAALLIQLVIWDAKKTDYRMTIKAPNHRDRFVKAQALSAKKPY